MASPVTGRSEAVTEGVRVTVECRYLPERSSALTRQFLFGYTVTIKNETREPVKLLTRHWIITDAAGEVQQVEGVGVVGETPVIGVGGSHTYGSFCPLRTEFGTMAGSYGMIRPSGATFRAEVALFRLVLPSAVN
jgi:ApaG protein